jgi:hypothetical protein
MAMKQAAGEAAQEERAKCSDCLYLINHPTVCERVK